MRSAERSLSPWKATTTALSFPPLEEDAVADVCVIGGGIAGLTTAYLLARDGASVVLLERTTLGGGETGQTTAHLASAMDDLYLAIERMHGAAGARLARESHQVAIETIGRIATEEAVECDFERTSGYLFLAPGHSPEILEEERAAALRAGFAGVEVLPRSPADFWDTGPCLHFPDQGQFHPLRYLHGLARACVHRGVRIHTDTEVSENPVGGEPVRITTRSGAVVTADAVVVATNYPISRWLTIVPRLAAYRTFAIALAVPAGSVPHLLWWDTGDPYHYVRVTPGDDPETELLIVGGEDHKTGQRDDAVERFDSLQAWTRERFPMARETVHRWSGQVVEPADGMGFIGRQPGTDNLYVITGDSGQGMTHGTLGATLLADLIAGRENPWASLYDPSRAALAAPMELLRENLNAFLQYRDLLTRSDVDSVEAILPGTGAVIRRGSKPIAVYRDEAGNLTERSAICTHLECVVRWNTKERSWDCPCHGSRFAPDGTVLNGPAAQPLHQLDD